MNASNKHEPTHAALVDTLAALKARIAALQAEEEALKGAIIALGVPILEGTGHRCAVSYCEGRVTTDWRTIAQRFSPSRQLIAAHTTQGEAYHTVRLSAHKT